MLPTQFAAHPILGKTEEEILAIQARMRAQPELRLLPESMSLKEACLADARVLSETSISYDLIADVLEGIKEAFNQSQAQTKHRLKEAIVGQKFKVKKEIRQSPHPWICPFSPSFQKICHQGLQSSSFTLFTITNIENQKYIQITDCGITVIHHGFLPKGPFNFSTHTMIECLALKTSQYETVFQNRMIHCGTYDLTDDAIENAEKYQRKYFRLDGDITGYYLPYKNYQSYIGHGLTIQEFNEKHGKLDEESMHKIKLDYADWQSRNPEEISEEELKQITLEKDSNEQREFLHIFNDKFHDKAIQIILDDTTIDCYLSIEGIYVFESQAQRYAKISPQPRSRKPRRSSMPLKSSNNIEDVDSNKDTIVRFAIQKDYIPKAPIFIPRRDEENIAKYCMFLPLEKGDEPLQTAALQYKKPFFTVDDNAKSCVLPDNIYKSVDEDEENKKKMDFLYIVNTLLRDEVLRIEEVREYNLGAFIESPGIYVFQIPDQKDIGSKTFLRIQFHSST